MKRISWTVILIAAITSTSCAQKIDASKVPTAVKQAFAKAHPNVTVKWEKEDGKYEAGFKTGTLTISELYTAAGIMEETETDIEVSQLPAPVLTYVKENYKGKTIKEGAKIVKADGTIIYEAEVGGKDVLFDANGKFLKEVAD